MPTFRDYLAHDWCLTPLRSGTKQAYLTNWSCLDNAVRGVDRSDELGDAAGLLLAHCDPPLMSLDIDHFSHAAAYLDDRGIDLAQLLQRDDAVGVRIECLANRTE